MSDDQKELAKVIEKYFGADAGYLDIDCFTLARRIIEAGWLKPVRCKDCKFYELKYFPDGKMKMNCENNKGIWTNTQPDCFCYYGERENYEK